MSKRRTPITRPAGTNPSGDYRTSSTTGSTSPRQAGERRPTPPSKSAVNWSSELIYGRRNYQIMGIGLLLIVAGLFAMAGGAMPSPDVWDDSIIYSARRITLAPILMLLGFGVVGYGIFASNGEEEDFQSLADAVKETAE